IPARSHRRLGTRRHGGPDLTRAGRRAVARGPRDRAGPRARRGRPQREHAPGAAGHEPEVRGPARGMARSGGRHPPSGGPPVPAGGDLAEAGDPTYSARTAPVTVTSTGAPSGSDVTPTAARACLPTSPNT